MKEGGGREGERGGVREIWSVYVYWLISMHVDNISIRLVKGMKRKFIYELEVGKHGYSGHTSNKREYIQTQ